ncbi:c-type cytochrome [Massilia sp. GCM10020059]|uniref:Cytochrome c4 n=1 Tax=Massilia agrisoli TaxID=2892444 RepID=A0ABS8IXK9_9BURK|nr:cytochrome c4 [Massilia agrisoli]MCC6072893.1 cytochrome c4 [Massilia agrisoli]
MRAPALLLLACAAGPAAAARPATLPDTMEQRVLACTSCHARPDRNDAFFPRISGKPAGYLYNQLVNFKTGARQFPMMTYMVNHLPDAYLREIAEHFSRQHLPPLATPQPALPAAVMERGRVLAMQGDRAIGVPACIACHGKALSGVTPSIPGLVGLPRDYVNAQFGAWKNKVRRAHAPDCMADIANRLSLADVSAVSGWLAAQPVSPSARPDTAIARPLPIACGSAP